jgi:hypothetical protein
MIQFPSMDEAPDLFDLWSQISMWSIRFPPTYRRAALPP